MSTTAASDAGERTGHGPFAGDSPTTPTPPTTPATPTKQTTPPAAIALRTWRMALLLLLLLFTLVPFAALIVQSFASWWYWPRLWPETLSIGAWRDVVFGPLGRATLTSGGIAIATALVSCSIALPVGRMLARLPGRTRHVAAALVFLPVAAPPIALGTGLQVALLSAGLGGTAPGVWLAHCVPAAGYASLLFLGVFTLTGQAPEEAARTLGASPWQVWSTVLMPALRAPIAEALAITFLISWTQVALTLVIGGGAVRALPVEVLSLVRAGQDQYAAVGALLLVAPAVLALAALRFAVKRTSALPA